jgi:hypothetical protein
LLLLLLHVGSSMWMVPAGWTTHTRHSYLVLLTLTLVSFSYTLCHLG